MSFWPWMVRKPKFWEHYKNLSVDIDEMKIDDARALEKDLDTLNFLDQKYVKRSGKSFLVALLGVVAYLSPAITGWIINVIPGYFATKFAMTKVPKGMPEFQASLVVVIGMGFYVLYYLIGLIISVLVFGWLGFLFLLGIPLGFVFLWWKNNLRSSLFRKKYHWSMEESKIIRGIFTKHNIDLTI